MFRQQEYMTTEKRSTAGQKLAFTNGGLALLEKESYIQVR
jgi:hypothetical protein